MQQEQPQSPSSQQMDHEMQHHHHHHHNSMNADHSLLQKLPSLSNNSNGLMRMDGMYMSDLTMKRGMAPSISGSSLASSDTTSRGSMSYDGDGMESQEENDFDDSFTSQSTNGSAVVSGLVGNKGFVDGSGMDFNTTNPPHHDSSNLFNQYSMKSNSSSDFKNDAGLGATGSPNFSSASTSASPTSNSQSFPSNFSPNSFTSHQARLSGSGFRGLDGGSPRGSTSSMVSLSPRDTSSNLRSNSYTSSPSQHYQLQSMAAGSTPSTPNSFNSPLAGNGNGSGNGASCHRPSLGESLGLTLGQQASEASPTSRTSPNGIMQQAVTEYSLISGPTPMSNFGHSTYNMNSFSASKSRPGPGPPPKLSLPPLNLFQNQIAGNSNAPYTPGGSYFSGARDGAASGEPLSPFEPPTPLKKMSGDGKDFNNSNPMDSPLNRYAKLSFVGPIGSASQMMDGVAGSPTGSSSAHAHALSRLQRKRPSLPPALGGRGLARRASDSPSSQSYSVGSIPPYGQQQESLPVPVSPLSKEFANVNVGAGINGDGEMQVDATGMDSDEHMRTLTRSSVDAVMGLRQLNEEAAVASYSSNGPQSAATSPSTVSVNSMSTTATSDFTPPCSPLEFSQGASISKQKQRSASPMATDMRRTSSGNKPRAKESFIGSNMSPSNQAHSMTTRAKKSQQSATTATSSHSVKSRSVSPPSLELPSGLSKQVNVEVQMPSSAPPTQTTFGSSITGIPSSQGAMTLSPPIEKQSLPVLRAVPMAKSNSAPAPMTVSAKHLSNKDLNPRFVESYELTDELGSGGFGFVVSARRRSDDLKVAVKFIFKNKVPSHGWVRDPQLGIVPMELFVLKVVNSPFVVKFIEAFDDSEFFYLVMEHHGSPWVANTKENKAAAASALAAKDKQPKAPAMKSSKSLPGSRPPVASSTPIKSIAAFTLAADSPTVAVFAPNSNTPSLTSDSEMSDSEPGSRSSVSNSSSSPSAPSRPGMPQRRLSCDLFECIEQHSKLGETNARWVFAQVVEAVYHLDRMGISHRDIKDENCVVDSDFNVKLIDFGSAVISDVRKPAPFFNRFFGTMTFASSEILKGQPYRAPNAEVWSLGVLLSILLSGECPFEDPKAAMEGRIAHGKGWSREAKEIIHGCLEVDPDRRANIREVRDHPWVRKAWREQGRERPQ